MTIHIFGGGEASWTDTFQTQSRDVVWQNRGIPCCNAFINRFLKRNSKTYF